MRLRPHHCLVLLVSVAACDFGPDADSADSGCAHVEPIELDFEGSSNGDLGRAEFALERCSIFACGLSRPLVTGHHNDLRVTAADELALEIADVTSSDPAVLFVAGFSGRQPDGSHTIAIEALAPGTADVVLTAEGGAVIDRTTIEVADPIELVVESGFEPEPFEVGVGAQGIALAIPRDALGRELNAFDEIVWSSANEDVALPQQTGIVGLVDGIAQGTTLLRATLGELEGELEITVK